MSARSLTCILVLTAGCASHLSTAETYRARGRHELATHYYAAHYRAEIGDDAEAARQQLVTSFRSALQAFDADFRRALESQQHQEALGIALRREALVDLARDLQIGELDAVEANALTREGFPRAAQFVVASVDEAESAGRSAPELLELLRRAAAYKPHDMELAERYERTRNALQINVAVEPECPLAHVDACNAFVDRLVHRLTQTRRELLVTVTGDSSRKNAALVIEDFSLEQDDTGWNVIRSGQLQQKVLERNRFKEVVEDDQGNKQYETVSAHFTLYGRSTSARLSVSVAVQDLGPSREILFEHSTSVRKTDERNYYTWRGDERALTSLKRYGTNQAPPDPPQVLARRAWSELADTFAKSILAKLENP